MLARMTNYDLIILNFANPDMVGHTGVVAAGIKAVETIDECVSRIIPELLRLAANVWSPPITAIANRCAMPMGRPIPRIPPIWFTASMLPKTLQTFRCQDGILADVAPTLLFPVRYVRSRRK